MCVQVLRTIMGAPLSPSPSSPDIHTDTSNWRSTNNCLSTQLHPSSLSQPRHKSPSLSRVECHDILNWTPWKTGIVFAFRGRTLLVIKQAINKPGDNFQETWGDRIQPLQAEYRIEVHIYTNEWVTLSIELSQLDLPSLPLERIPGLATKLLVMLTGHVKTLATTYFSGMLSLPPSGMFTTYMPCWKCCAEINSPKNLSTGETTTGCVPTVALFLI